MEIADPRPPGQPPPLEAGTPPGAGSVVDRWVSPFIVLALDVLVKAFSICFWYMLFAPLFDAMWRN